MNALEVWSHINETLEALKWPCVVALVVFGFRKQIGDRIRSVRRYKGPAGEIDFNEVVEADQLTASLSEGVAGVIRTVHIDGEERRIDAEPVGAEFEAGGSESPSTKPDLLDLRKDIEDIITAAYGSGFEAGASGRFTVAPRPQITWTGAQPTVTGWTLRVTDGRRLTPTDLDILRLRDRGDSMRQIAMKTDLSSTAVAHIFRRIQDKLDVDSPEDAVRRAAELELL